jgi:hypothetical protein
MHDFLIRQSDFLYTIKSRIPDKNDVIVRIFDSIDLRIQSAERFLYDFANLQRSNPAEFALINFTNIQNGSGIFSSKATSCLTGFRLDFRALDSLVTSPLTRHLKFAKYWPSISYVCRASSNQAQSLDSISTD